MMIGSAMDERLSFVLGLLRRKVGLVITNEPQWLMESQIAAQGTDRRDPFVRAALGVGLLALVAIITIALLQAAPRTHVVQPSSPTGSPMAATTSTVDTTATPVTHNPSEVDCVVCHFPPGSHEIDPYTCAECHEYDDWNTATHPDGRHCRACHSTPANHLRTTTQCSAC